MRRSGGGTGGHVAITPRETRLLRARTLRAFQRAIVEAVVASHGTSPAPVAVLTPTRAATGQLRRTLDAVGVDRQVVLLTRNECYEWLRERVGPCPPLLTPVQREVVGRGAAADALAAGSSPPFRLRPGIVAALLAFYDELRRHRRSVDAFERLMVEELDASADLDRGARRLLLQTRFLVAAFRAYDRRLDAAPGLDEHRLRERLLAADVPAPVSEMVVTVPDHVAQAGGLYPADFDLLARLPRLARITLIATDAMLDSGYRERLEDLLPGLAESRAESGDGRPAAIVVPDASDAGPCFVRRDREEELRGIARQVSRLVAVDGRLPASAAVVVQRPLPYLYLAPSVFGDAALPVRAGDALPLAVEPYVAAVDLVVTFAASGFGQRPAVELLRSPHLGFDADGAPPTAAAIAALDRALSEIGLAGGWEALNRCAEEWQPATGTRQAALAALRCVLAAADELRPLLSPRPLADQIATLLSFLEQHARDTGAGEGDAARRATEARARVWRGLEALGAADRSLNRSGSAVDIAEVASIVRRWTESQTFRSGAPVEGVHLVDVQAAAYGRFDDVFIAGLVESEWPGRTSRNIFYPGGLLAGLGWPRERDRQRAARAAFHDLLGLAIERVWLSTFNLEDDAIVTASPLIEDLEGAQLERLPAPGPGDASWGGRAASVEEELGRRWRALRVERASRSDHAGGWASGLAGPQPERAYTVSSLERYAACPFQYLATHTLGLEPERPLERTMTTERRGRFLHRVFESFFRGWQAAGQGPVTLANLDVALERFTVAAEHALDGLPPIDRAVARGWLLGSAAAPGLAERVFVAEIEGQTGVVERLLEYRVDGRFELGRPPARRTVAIRGVVDRIDLHADRTLRVIDYKASRPPHPSRALQLPVYASCAERQLRAERGQEWRATEALYVAFGDPRLQVSVPGGDIGKAVADGEARVVELVEAIEAGRYPARPVDRALCASCAFPTVCRKDHVGEA